MTATTTEGTQAANTPADALAEARGQALALLQRIDPDGTYTDETSEEELLEPCTLADAIRAARTVVEGEAGGGQPPTLTGELLGLLAQWAWEMEENVVLWP